MSNLPNDGATVAPLIEADKIESAQECPGDNTGRRFKHMWNWVWHNGVWTDKVQCSTCGKIETRVRT